MRHVFVKEEKTLHSFTDTHVVSIVDGSICADELEGKPAVTVVEKDPIFYSGIVITGGCNLECRYCTADAMLNAAAERSISLADFESIIEQLANQGLVKVSITGGEPFVHPNLLDLYNILGKHNIQSNINSNGTLVRADVVKRMIDNGLQEIDISITDLHDDGAIYRDKKNRAHVRWNRLGGLINELKGKVLFRASTVLTREVVDNLFVYEAAFAEMGVDLWLQRELLFTATNYVADEICPEPGTLIARMKEFAAAKRKMAVQGYLYEICAGLHRKRRCHNLEKNYIYIYFDKDVHWLARLLPERIGSLATQGVPEIATLLNGYYTSGVPERCSGCSASYFCVEHPDHLVPS